MDTFFKIKYNSSLFICLLLLVSVSSAMNLKLEVDLKGKWRFEIGDNMEFAHPEFNDLNWGTINAPEAWENQGFPSYDGYAWYRISIEIPQNLQDKKLYLKLGRIDDVDMVFVNGKLIGQQGEFPPQYRTAFDEIRIYEIPQNFLKFGTKNVFAIRVYDDRGQGGIVSNGLGIYSRKDVINLSLFLNGNWKFSVGDDLTWAKTDFDDSNWKIIKVPSTWENQGYKKHDGFGWYRKKVSIPRYLMKSELILLLGKINDIDEVFFNGILIGSTGDFSQKENIQKNRGMYRKERAYSIPSHLILPDESNLITVRVFDHGNKGGIYEGYVGISTQEEYLQYLKKCE
jgi:hypothetical protein